MLRRNQWIGIVAGLALLAWGGVAFYRAQVRHNLWPRNFGVVQDGKIFRGGAQSPAMLKALVERHKIKTIVDLGAYSTPEAEKQTTLAAKALGVERFEFRLKGDGTGDPNNYVKALHIITDPSKQPVLVHCATGAQRTSACVVFYRVTTQGRTLDEAYAEAPSYKHDPSDNQNLRPYLDKWAQPIARSFRSGQMIDYVEPRASTSP